MSSTSVDGQAMSTWHQGCVPVNEIKVKQSHEDLEYQKVLAEVKKLNSETVLNSKKANWFEFTLVLVVIALTVAVTKLFL